ncbi:TAXI family TRAP transporter solute-binding subunit [Streptomyces sp. NPDC054784]
MVRPEVPYGSGAVRGARALVRRRAVRAAGAVAVVLGLLLWWLLPSSDPAPSGNVTFATGVPTGVYARYGTLLQQRLGRDAPDLDLGLRASEGSVENIEMLVSGKADFTIAQSDAVADYLDSGGEGAERLSACARLYDDYVQLVVPADSPVRSARDLRGLRVGTGEARSGVNLVAGRLLRAAGLDRERDLREEAIGIDRMPSLLAKGELDAFLWTGGLPTSAIEQLARHTRIRLVQLGDLVPRLQRMEPETRYYRPAVMPADAYPDVQQGEPVDTVAVSNLLVTTDRTDPDVAEAVTRSLINSRDQIGNEVHAAQKVDLRTAIYTDPLPLHTGAERYYRAVKP